MRTIIFDDAQPKAGVPTRNLLGALLVSVIGLAGLLDAQAPSHGPESIRAEELREKVSYLASDEFRGRGNGTADLDRAADYIAAAFAESGLPSGPDGSYFQEFTVERLSLGDGNVFETTGSRTEVFRPGRDFVPVTTSPNGVVEGPLAFAGYGIRAPALDYDDFSGVDVAGRIAVVLDGQPRARDRDSPFNVASLDEFSSIPSKAANAARAGAIGLIVVQGPLGSAASIGSFAARLRPGLSPRNVTMELPPDRDGTAIPTVLLSRGAGPRLLPGLRAIQAGIDRDLESRSSLLSWSARLVVDLTRDAYTARNVIARVPGSNPSLREEVVVVGAHYDHDGAENGRIWNGADDDASGTSALLELAEAFGSGVRPGRTVLLSAWAGEEKGMLGSRHYVRDPVEPLARTVAMVQLDMIGRNEDHPANRGQGVPAERARQNENSINVLGSIFSPEFRLLLEKSNASVGLDLRFRYDRGAENLLQRSDHWSFLVRGVPALFIFGGMHPDYHTPNDTADKINYLKMENVVKLVYHALLELGERPSGPALTNPQASQ